VYNLCQNGFYYDATNTCTACAGDCGSCFDATNCYTCKNPK
jgi:hypothetical protein